MADDRLHLNGMPTGVLQKIFHLLGPRDLSRAGSVCRLWRCLNRDDAADGRWRSLYAQRWPPGACAPIGGWQAAYGAKVLRTRVWRGKYETDSLFGHKAGVRCVRLLPERGLAATGSLDKTVILWDLSAGMSLATSKSHGGTVRCLALSRQQLISGSADAALRIWNIDPDCFAGGRPDLSAPIKVQGIHTGPISGLALTEDHFVSGSWDCSVRIWSCSTLECVDTWQYSDWVWAVLTKGQSVVVSAGKEVLFQDMATGKLLRRFQNSRKEGRISSIEGSEDGALFVTGSGDGSVLLHDVRVRSPVAELWCHNGAVSGLSFEDPWVVSCSHDGTVALVNTEKGCGQREALGAGPLFEAAANRRQLASPGGPVLCVHMADQWLACGSESPVVRTFNFSRAEERERRKAAQKSIRRARRQRVVNRQSRVWDLGDEEGSEEEDRLEDVENVEPSGSNRSCVPEGPDSDPDTHEGGWKMVEEGDEKLESGTLHLRLPESCRREAGRRPCWRKAMHGSARGGESTDEGDMVEGLA